MKAKYAKVEANINTISDKLENHQVTLLKDVATIVAGHSLCLTVNPDCNALASIQHCRLIESADSPIINVPGQSIANIYFGHTFEGQYHVGDFQILFCPCHYCHYMLYKKYIYQSIFFLLIV